MDAKSARLIAALCQAQAYGHPVGPIEVIETHISWVLLTGPFAYKVKKPLRLSFADFSTLERRQFFCEEELRLNRRLAHQLYLGVVPITGTPDTPRVDGPGEPFEWAVKMKQLPREARLDRVLARGELTAAHIDDFAQQLADFHLHAAIADTARGLGDVKQALRPSADTFDELSRLVTDETQLGRVQALQRWAERRARQMADAWPRRQQQARIREGHGDLHLENLLLVDDRVVPFDCLEFNERLRWIDVMSDLAFAVMDLAYRGRPDFAWRLLNRYLDETGDREGLLVLNSYLVYRALVRAKVALIRLAQPEVPAVERAKLTGECESHVALAEQFAGPPGTRLILTHGPSGSGKSSVSQELLETLGAIRLRSDIERQRIADLSVKMLSLAERQAALYSESMGQRTYTHLLDVSRLLLAAGWSVVVDATFLRRAQREPFFELARWMQVPLVVLDFQAPVALLRERIDQRLRAGTDASQATERVLEAQLAQREPLAARELPWVYAIDARRPPSAAVLAEAIQGRAHIPD